MSLDYFFSDEYRKHIMDDFVCDPVGTLISLYNSYGNLHIDILCPFLAKAFDKIKETRRKNIERYNPARDGAVNAIRIFYADGTITPMAELAFAFGDKVIIQWDLPSERDAYDSGINAYTVIYDERPKRPDFNDWVKQKH